MATVLIKRYPNRKLYNTEAKRYITLDGISQLIREGHDVEVRDHQTGEDLTGVTLSQIIFEREKKDSGYLPSALLANLIRAGGESFGYVRRSFQASLNAMRVMEAQVDQRIDALVRRGELGEDEARQLREEFHSSASRPDLDVGAIDTHIESALHRLNIPSRVDFLRLQSQIEQLAQALDTLEGFDADEAGEDLDEQA